MPQNNQLQKDELKKDKDAELISNILNAQIKILGTYMRFDSGLLFPATNNDNGRPIVTEDIPCEIIQPKQIENGRE